MSDTTKMIPAPQGVAVRGSATATEASPADAGISRELIQAMAMQIGKDTVAYVEVMYPEAIKATSSTFKLSLRNHIYNEIISLSRLSDEATIRARLATDEKFRKEWLAQWRKIRRKK